jgi:HlyD family secretion protein
MNNTHILNNSKMKPAKINNIFCLSIFSILLISCTGNKNKSDAFGNFESTDVLVASEMQGKLVTFTPEEGDTLNVGKIVGLVDTIQLSLKREQLIAQRNISYTKFQNIKAQVDVQEEQKKTLLIEKNRLENLLKDNAAPVKQLDDINGKIKVTDSQISSIKTQNASTESEIEMLSKQIDQITDQINRSKITNPINGTVLEKYIEPQEIVTPGKILYKIADLKKIILRAYISGAQLSQVKTGQKVTVLIDADEDKYKEYQGTITWISSQTEFTPKIIQTKKERVNMVYAIKIEVANDGYLKIGMPGEVRFGH